MRLKSTNIFGKFYVNMLSGISFLSCYVVSKYIYLLKVAIELLSLPKDHLDKE